LPSEEGALISDIYRGGPAHRAGIRRGDVVVAFNGQPVKNSRELARWVTEIPIGTTVKIDVLREGSRQTFEVTVAEAPVERGS
jgi:serine protease Do